MGLLLSTYGSLGVDPMAGLSVRLRTLGAELLGNVDVRLVPTGGWR
jgi:hypothetical protein